MIKAFERFKDILLSRDAQKGEDVSIADAGYVVLDTELTGLNVKNDSIISVGAVRMSGKRINVGDVFYRLVSPSTEMRHESIVVHGITPSDLQEKPPIETVLYELLDFCGSDIIVGHFLSLDMDFINKAIKRVSGATLYNRLIDTYRLHEWIRMNDGAFSSHYNGMSEELNLFALARKYKVPISGAHNALNDAYITAQLFQRFLSFLPGLGVRTLSDLLRVGKP